MLASDLIKSYESFCPPELSMEGDVVGLQIGSLDKEIQKVMVTLDVRENTVAEVIEKGVDLIIAKHAPRNYTTINLVNLLYLKRITL